MISIVAEIGINHNGCLSTAKKLIDVASQAGCNFVKFQKRNPEKSVPEHQKNKIKDSIWGSIRYIDYKHKLEFSKKEYDIIDSYCKKKNIGWFCSVWDFDSVDFLVDYKNEFFGNFIKVPSALITNIDLLTYAKKNSDFLAISTGMSDEKQIKKAIKKSDPDLIFHTNSSYPSPYNEINLKYITWLRTKYSNKLIGYSGHEQGYIPTIASVGIGVDWIERHITLNKNFKGSDHSSSLEPNELFEMVKGVRTAEHSLGVFEPRKLSKSEYLKKSILRKN